MTWFNELSKQLMKVMIRKLRRLVYEDTEEAVKRMIHRKGWRRHLWVIALRIAIYMMMKHEAEYTTLGEFLESHNRGCDALHALRNQTCMIEHCYMFNVVTHVLSGLPV